MTLSEKWTAVTVILGFPLPHMRGILMALFKQIIKFQYKGYIRVEPNKFINSESEGHLVIKQTESSMPSNVQYVPLCRYFSEYLRVLI